MYPKYNTITLKSKYCLESDLPWWRFVFLESF